MTSEDDGGQQVRLSAELDVRPELPWPAMPHGSIDYYSAGQMTARDNHWLALIAERDKTIERLKNETDFYKRRCDLLQQWQRKMRDPERTLVCDVLANGQTLPDPQGTRYPQEPTAKSNLFISDEDQVPTREHVGRYG